MFLTFIYACAKLSYYWGAIKQTNKNKNVFYTEVNKVNFRV